MGNTPVYGWPYPESSDPPDGAAQIAALANGIDNTLDPDKIEVTRSGWTGAFVIHRFGVLLVARWNATPDSGTANLTPGFVWGTVPGGVLWPGITTYFVTAGTTGGTETLAWNFTTGGELQCQATATVTALRGTMTAISLGATNP